MDMMELGLLRDNFKYLVVNTGYTSRLIEDVDDIEEKIKERFKSSCNDEDYILYIQGDFEEHYANDQLKKEYEYVKGVIKNRSGVIILRCENNLQAFDLIDILMQQDYCCWGSMVNLELKDDILITEFDCESG